MIRQPRTSQPQGSVSLDYSVLGRPVFLYCGSLGELDLASSSTFTKGSAFARASSRSGIGAKQTASNSGLQLSGKAIPSLSSGYTAIWSGVFLGAFSGSTPKLVGISGSSTSQSVDIIGIEFGSTTQIDVTFKAGATSTLRNFAGAVTWVAGDLVTICAVYDIGAQEMRLSTCVNGKVLRYSSALSSPTAPTILGTEVCVVGPDPIEQPTRFVNAAVSLAGVFQGAVSIGAADAFVSNPWSIFQPVNRAIWVLVAAAGGSPYTLTADTANVPIAGTATGLAFNRTLVAEAAALAINGTATGLAFNRVLTADTANLALTGNAATLTYTPIGGPTYTLTADTANTAITGADAGLAFNRRLIADTANLPISGTDAGLARGYTLAADTTSLGISGSDAALIAVRKLVADAYALAVAGADATLTYTPLTLPTIGRPASDTSNTGWTASTGVDLYAMLDEVTPSAADYISASSVGAVCKMALGTTAYPGTASQVLKYRASSSTGNSVIVRLKEGATTIRAETQVLTSTDTEYSITLTSGEIAAITSGSLSVELESA